MHQKGSVSQCIFYAPAAVSFQARYYHFVRCIHRSVPTHVPPEFRHAVFDSLHSLFHPGIQATQHLITARYVGPGMNSDVRRRARCCLHCQLSKVHWHTTAPLATFTTPYSQFDKVHIDLVGPLPPSWGYVYLLTCIDCFTH